MGGVLGAKQPRALHHVVRPVLRVRSKGCTVTKEATQATSWYAFNLSKDFNLFRTVATLLMKKERPI